MTSVDNSHYGGCLYGAVRYEVTGPLRGILLYHVLAPTRQLHCRKETDIQCFVDAVFWMAALEPNGWLLPGEFGRWNSVYKRCSR